MTTPEPLPIPLAELEKRQRRLERMGFRAHATACALAVASERLQGSGIDRDLLAIFAELPEQLASDLFQLSSEAMDLLSAGEVEAA